MNKMPQSAQQAMPSTPLNLVSTEQIQKYLDENKNLIMAILECQKMGKVAECAQYQAILQKNLMYLAAIADAQPPGSNTTPSQISTSSVGQQSTGGGHQLLQQQQPGGQVPKLPFQLNAQDQLLQFQQHQQMQPHFGLPNNAALHANINMMGNPPQASPRGNTQGNSGFGRNARE